MRVNGFFSTALGLFIFSNAIAQQTFYDVTQGNGNGVRFWSNNGYKIHMGNDSEHHFGPVTDKVK